jgi:hypothetical protein
MELGKLTYARAATGVDKMWTSGSALPDESSRERKIPGNEDGVKQQLIVISIVMIS